MVSTPDLGIPELAQSQANPDVTHNRALILFQALANGVIDKDLTAPPGSPVEGDAYLINTASPTGAWAGRGFCIAIYWGTSWYFVPGENDAGTPITMGARQEGLRVYVRDEGAFYVWRNTTASPASFDWVSEGVGPFVERDGDTMSGSLAINLNTATAPTPPTGDTPLHLVGANGTATRALIDTVGVNPTIIGRRANGTLAAPSQVLTNQGLFTTQGFGYGATGYSSGTRGSVSIRASEDWTDTAQGTSILFSTTANLGTTQTSRWIMENDGSLIYSGGSTTGVSTINAVDYFDNGANINTIYGSLANAQSWNGLNTFNAGMTVNQAGNSFQYGMSSTTVFSITRSVASSGSPNVRQRKSRGADVFSPAVVVLNDGVAATFASAYDGSNYIDVFSQITTMIEPTPGVGTMGSRTTFNATGVGSSTLTEVMRIEANTGLSMYGANPVIDNNRLHRRRVYTFGTLPAAGTAGRMAAISDGAAAPVWGAAAAGGGAVYTNVTDTGAAWING